MTAKERIAELSKNQKAIAGFTKLIVGLIIFGIAAYSDIQFIMIMWKAFPDGIAKIFSLIGAVATGMSVLALVIAEAYWFSRGPQMVFGWFFTGLEVFVSVANVILSFAMTAPHLDGLLAFWLSVCPATPFVAFVGWIVVLNLDEGQKARHEYREMQDDLAAAEREHAKAVHKSQMALKTRYLESTTTYLDQISNDPRIQAGLEAGAWKFAAEELRALTGLYLVAPNQQALPPNGQAIPSLPPQSQSQQSNEPPVEEEGQPITLAMLQQLAQALFQAKKEEEPPNTDALPGEHLVPFVAAPEAASNSHHNGHK